MLRIGCILSLLALSACLTSQKVILNFYEGGHDAVHYYGRFDFSSEDSPKVWAPGAYCTFKFKGEDCEVTILDEMKFFVTHNYIAVIVDGGKPKRIKLTEVKNIITVATGLADTIHEVTICKNTEAAIGYIQFAGFKCERLVPFKAQKKKVIEFIGDSITCGNGSDTSSIACSDGKWYDQHNAYLSYGPLVARKFDCDWILSAVSGIGLTRSCCGTTYTMPDVYTKIDFKPDGPKWKRKGQKPDIICITLGQNDGLQEANTYISTYVSFVKKIRKRNPNAQIICCSSPMADEQLQAYQKEHLPTIVSLLEASKVEKVSFFCYTGRYRGGCLFHPTLSEHQEIAKELMGYLEKTNFLI